MIKQDFHVHTTYCDGKSTPEQLVEKAISLNFDRIGLVCHTYYKERKTTCILPETVKPFVEEIKFLNEKYKGQIKVYCGVEFDYFSTLDVTPFDFVIGSVHCVKKNGTYISVDSSKKELVISGVNEHYNGDYYKFCEDYFETLGDIYSKVKPDFIAHFDVVTKYNRDNILFDVNDERYVSAWKKCADKLLEKNALFEINVGGVLKKYKDEPYISKAQIDYISKRGGRFILNSDSHSVDTLTNDIDKYIDSDIKLID